MRDVERHPMVQEIQRTRAQPVVKGWHEVLGADLNAKQRALLHLALSFHTWRALVQDAGLEQAAAIEMMVEVVEGAAN
jgi:hypothetical protein